MPVDASIRVLAVENSRLQGSTVALHWECPIGPDWARGFNAVSDVEQGMYCEGAGGHPVRIVLIIDSAMD